MWLQITALCLLAIGVQSNAVSYSHPGHGHYGHGSYGYPYAQSYGYPHLSHGYYGHNYGHRYGHLGLGYGHQGLGYGHGQHGYYGPYIGHGLGHHGYGPLRHGYHGYDGHVNHGYHNGYNHGYYGHRLGHLNHGYDHGYNHGHVRHGYNHGPVYPNYHHDNKDHYAFPEYSFSYSVHDPHTGDIKAQHETRHGDHVVGNYQVHQPDGHVRHVDYKADDHHGFQANVHFKSAHPQYHHHDRHYGYAH